MVASLCSDIAQHPVVFLDNKVGVKLEGCVTQMSSLVVQGIAIEAQLLSVFFAVEPHTSYAIINCDRA